MTGPTDAFLKGYVDLGFTPPAFWFWSSTTIETLAGISLILGLFTRFFAAAAAIELLIITTAYWSNGFGWLHRGYEYTLLWGCCALRSRCAAAGPIRSIASSAASCDSKPLERAAWIIRRSRRSY